MPLARTTTSIDNTTLDRFFRAYPAGKRSQIIQRLLEQDLSARDDQFACAAEMIEANPDFQTVHDDSALWERATASDGLERTSRLQSPR